MGTTDAAKPGMGGVYFDSDGEAYVWCSRAAAGGDEAAAERLDSLAAALTPEQLDQARQRVPRPGEPR